MTQPPPLLTAVSLQRTVGGQRLFSDFSLDLAAGERVMLTGPSGSGKSLLLRLLAGLDPLESGSVAFGGQTQERWRMPDYRAAVMLLPQRAALGAGTTVRDVLAQPFGLKVHAHKTPDWSQAKELAERLGRAANFLDLAAATLSGGEGQLVALMRALLLGPSVLLLDEATSALDPETVARAERVITAWCADGERALVIVSHDPAQRARLGTRLLPLHPAASVLERPT